MRILLKSVVLALALLALGGGPAAAEGAPLEPPKMDPSQIGRTAVTLAAQYLKEAQAAFSVLDAMIEAPVEIPIEASQAWEQACAKPLETLALFRNAAAEHAGTNKVPAVYTDWVQGQFDAWAVTSHRGARTVYVLSSLHDVLKVWNEITIPYLGRKKTKFRKVGEELNELYREAQIRTAIRGDGGALVTEVESRRKLALPMAYSLGKSLVALRDLLKQDLKSEAPEGGLQKTCEELVAALKTPPEKLPGETIWLTHFAPWADKVDETKQAFLDAYAKLREVSEAIRKQRLYHKHDKPIRKIKPYEKMGPEFERLFDELLSKREEIRDRLKELRKQAEKDRERWLKLCNKYGALEEREWRLKEARAWSASEEREIRARNAQRTTPGGEDYTRLWRQHVEDADVPYEEMKKRENDAFKRAWKQHEKESTAQFERDMAAMKKRHDEMVAEHEAWTAEGEREFDELQKEFDEQAKEWEEIGLSPPPVYNQDD